VMAEENRSLCRWPVESKMRVLATVTAQSRNRSSARVTLNFLLFSVGCRPTLYQDRVVVLLCACSYIATLL
jgi:hypothetical protein